MSDYTEAVHCSGCRPLPCGIKTPLDLPVFLRRDVNDYGPLSQELGTATSHSVAGCEARSGPLVPTTRRLYPLTSRDLEVIAELEGDKVAQAKTRLVKLREKFDDMQGKIWDTRTAKWVAPPHPDRVPVINATRRAQGLDQSVEREHGTRSQADRISKWNASLIRERKRSRS